MKSIKIGDHVICAASGVKGIVIKQYYPTACEQQTMIRCEDGRLYHAPTREFRRVAFSYNEVILPKLPN